MGKEFYLDMKLQFERNSETIENIKKRTTHLLSIIGIIFTGYAGLFGWILIDSKPYFEFWVIVATHAALIIALVLCLFIILTSNRKTPITSKELLKKCCHGYELNEEVFNVWSKLSSKEYYDEMTKAYLECIQDSEKKSSSIGLLFNGAVLVFIIGICLPLISIVNILS